MFNWWSFAFGVINFFIVLFILYRLLFKPIKRVIQEREDIINKRLGIVTQKEKEALELKQKYEKELKNIKTLKQKIINEANVEAIKEKEKILSEAKSEAKKILEKEKKIIEEEKQKIYKYIIDKSKEFSITFTTKLLKHIIDRELNQQIIKKFLENFEKEYKDILKKRKSQELCKVSIILADKVDESILELIDDMLLRSLKCKSIEKEIKIDEELIGGIKIRVKESVFDGSIKAQIENVEDMIEHSAFKEL